MQCIAYPIFNWEYWLSNWEYLEPMVQQLHSFLLFCCCEEKLLNLKVKASSMWWGMIWGHSISMYAKNRPF